MNETGTRNPACGIDTAGLTTSGIVHYNLAAAALTEQAIRRGEARLTAHGALVAPNRQPHRPFAQGQVHRPRRG